LLLLLLLLFLLVNQRLRHRMRCLVRQWSIRGSYLYSNAQLALSVTLKDTSCWWYVGIVPAHCYADVALSGYAIVSRIEPYPPQPRPARLDPRMRCGLP